MPNRTIASYRFTLSGGRQMIEIPRQETVDDIGMSKADIIVGGFRVLTSQAEPKLADGAPIKKGHWPFPMDCDIRLFTNYMF